MNNIQCKKTGGGGGGGHTDDSRRSYTVWPEKGNSGRVLNEVKDPKGGILGKSKPNRRNNGKVLSRSVSEEQRTN